MNIRDSIHHMTHGRPYVFVIMAYHESKKAVSDCIHEVVTRDCRLACIRADEVPSAGHDLLAKIHLLIERAELVIAEITDPRPNQPSANVFYEIGYAVCLKKHPLLLIQARKKVPTDLKGLELIEYENSLGGIEPLKQRLIAHLRARLSMETAVLRDMLEAPRPTPSFIVASPRRPADDQQFKIPGAPVRTFGDRLGILGLISAFGSMFGESTGVEFVSGRHEAEVLLRHDANLYLIGSPKVARPVAEVLRLVQAGRATQWEFDTLPARKASRAGRHAPQEQPLGLFRVAEGTRHLQPATSVALNETSERVWTEDHGLIVRAPHPRYEGRLALVLAGAHSLGTGAACLVATRSPLIRKLRDRLPSLALENKDQPFWAVVKGRVEPPHFLLDEDGVTVEAAGVFE